VILASEICHGFARVILNPTWQRTPNNPTFPGPNGLIGPGRSPETPASSSSAMNDEWRMLTSGGVPIQVLITPRLWVPVMALVMRMMGRMDILFIIHPVTILPLHILTITLLTRTPQMHMDGPADRKSLSQDSQDRRRGQASRH